MGNGFLQTVFHLEMSQEMFELQGFKNILQEYITAILVVNYRLEMRHLTGELKKKKCLGPPGRGIEVRDASTKSSSQTKPKPETRRWLQAGTQNKDRVQGKAVCLATRAKAEKREASDFSVTLEPKIQWK